MSATERGTLDAMRRAAIDNLMAERDAARAERDSLQREVEAARTERDRAIETRENANTVSVRVEDENAALRREVERLTHLARTLRQALIVNREASSTTNVSNGATRRAEQITSHAIGLAGEALSEPDPDARATTTDGD